MVDKVSEVDVYPTSLRSRREEEKEERRRQVLDAAEVVILREGWERANFGMIAKEARLSRSLVYFYYKTRDELFHAVCGRGMVELEHRFSRVLEEHKKGIDQVMAIGRAYHQFASECPLYFSLLSDYQGREAADLDQSPTEMEANAHGQNCLGLVAKALGNGLQDGTIKPCIGEPMKAAVTVWAFTHGLIQISMKKAKTLERDLGMSMTDSMEHGFGMIRKTLSASD